MKLSYLTHSLLFQAFLVSADFEIPTAFPSIPTKFPELPDSVKALANGSISLNQTLDGNELTTPINITLDEGTIISRTPNLIMKCKDCWAAGSLVTAAGCDDDDPLKCIKKEKAGKNFAGLPFDYSSYWVGAMLNNFEAHMYLDFELTPAGFDAYNISPVTNVIPPLNETTELNALLLPRDLIKYTLGIQEVFGISFIFNPSLHGWYNSTRPANFSYGLDWKIPDRSAIFVSIKDPKNVTFVGFNETKTTGLPYVSKGRNDSFSFQLGYRPIFSIAGGLKIPFVKTPSALRVNVFADIPKVDLNVTQVSNVLSDCRPAPSGTEKSKVFHGLTHVAPQESFDFGFNVTAYTDDHVFQTQWPIGQPTPMPTTCLHNRGK